MMRMSRARPSNARKRMSVPIIFHMNPSKARRHRKPRPEKFDPQYETFHKPIALSAEDMKDDPSDPLSWPSLAKPIYVISIRRNRMNGFVRRMGPWMKYCRRPPCTDGRFINRKQWIKRGWINMAWKKSRRLNMGQLGACGSHITAWRHIAEGPHEQGTIFEDDVAIDYRKNGHHIVRRMREAIRELEEKNVQWDMISWGHGSWAVKHNTKYPHLTHWWRPGVVQGFFAYTIKKSMAQRLIKMVYPFRTTIDNWVYDYLAAKNVFKIYTLVPSLCYVIPGPSETTKMLK